MNTRQTTRQSRRDASGLLAATAAGAGLASLALIILFRANRPASSETIDDVIAKCRASAEALDDRVSQNSQTATG